MESNAKPGAIGAIHHITAIAGSPAATDRFYRRLLGLRRVKQTVNFDDPFTYHLYYGDGIGRPGTLLTFFPWLGMPAGRPGAGSVTTVSFAVPKDAMRFWERRLSTAGVAVRRKEHFGQPLLAFADPDGLQLELVPTERTVQTKDHGWIGPVPRETAINGIFSATARASGGEQTQQMLVNHLGMQLVDRHGPRLRFEAAGTAGPGRFYDLVADPLSLPASGGVGTVHHIAFRAPGDYDQIQWRSRLSLNGIVVTPVIDRSYFRSIYFRAPDGILMEIATDAPGFAVDERPNDLGRTLKLPKQHEKRRALIEKRLPPLVEAEDLRHLHEPGAGAAGAFGLIVPLHGTGGDEHDLLPLARELFGSDVPVISPRGAVDENGWPRFFRRFPSGGFDIADLERRTHQLADFLLDARELYGHGHLPMTAIGYSNGANIAAAVLLRRPEVFDAAILLRPMMPLPLAEAINLSGKRILVLRGRDDRIIPAAQTDALEAALARAGADVCTVALDADHRLTAEDRSIARRWIEDSDACKAAA